MVDVAEIKKMFDEQLAYLNSGVADHEGSRAIAAGRAAGLGLDAQQDNAAKYIWSKEIPAVTGMPTFEEFRAGYLAHQAAFSDSDFASKDSFPAVGTAFSNAAGSYAYALDNAARGKEALAGGESQWAGYWGEKALLAAGFPEKAAQLNQAIISGKLLETVKTPTVPR